MINARNLTALLFAGSLTLSGCVIHVDGASDGDISSVFGGVDIAAGKHVDDISTVNGGVTLEEDATAGRIDAVNGSIELYDNASAKSIDVVNGDVDLARNVTIEDGIDTVNGDISAKSGSVINDDIETVNGDIELDDTVVDGGIETTNGDITLSGDTRVTGDIVFRRKQSNNWGSGTPTLTIERDVLLVGEIILQREVELELDNPDHRAKVIRNYTPDE